MKRSNLAIHSTVSMSSIVAIPTLTTILHSAPLTDDIKLCSCKQQQQNCFCFKVGGPGHGRTTSLAGEVLTDEEVESAIAVLRHSADEETIREKMKITFSYRHAIVNDHDKSGEVFSVFPRFLDTPGLVRHLHSLKSETYCNM